MAASSSSFSNDIEVEPSNNEGESSLPSSLNDIEPYTSIIGYKKPIMPPASDVWQHFTLVDVGEKLPGRELKQKILPSQTKKSGSQLDTNTYDPIALRGSIARYITKGELPFRHVESEEFKELIADFEPRLTLPSRTALALDVLQMYKAERDSLKGILVSDGQRVCLTADKWRSIQDMNYMCLTAHYIDSDWRYQKRIINFRQVLDHNGESLGRAIESCLLEWGIEKVLTVTVDNASSDDTTTITYLAKIVNNWKGSIMRSRFIHMRCCAHILNLVVTDGIKDYHGTVNKIRSVVRYWRGSPSRLLKFKTCLKMERITSKVILCHDDPTRWNSTYLMLEIALKFQRVFARLEEEDEDEQFASEFYKDGKRLSPTENDWDHARALTKFLKLFYDATLSFSGSTITRSNEFLWQLVVIHTQLNAWSSCDDKFLQSMGDTMKKKFDIYWGSYDEMNPFLFIALLVDPRHKEYGLEFCFAELCGQDSVKEMTDKVKNFLHELYDEYKLLRPPSEDHSPKPVSVEDSNYVTMAMINSRYLKKKKRKVVGAFAEVDEYLRESTVADTADFDILGYWKKNSEKYPILSSIAKDVLAIPISTVTSESAFSTGVRVLDAYRSSLNPGTVQALICTQNWLRSTESIDLRRMMDNIEEIEADLFGGASVISIEDGK